MKHRLIVLLALVVSLCTAHGARYAGGDISLLPLYEQLQAKYYDYDGNPIDDVIKFYADEGMNLMRVRLMVNPSDFPGGTGDSKNSAGKSWSYDPNCCQTLEYILPICQRIQAAGMNLLLDFHYTDYWADPDHQWTPESWKNLDDAGLCQKLYDYTKESLIWLRDRGVVPEFIQTGNEISFGMLYGAFGTSQANFKLATGENDRSCWERLTNMLKRAGQACREVCPDAGIVLHTEQVPNHWNLWNFYRWMGEFSVDYDIIGLSYYPYWHGDIPVAEAEITDLEKCFPDKKIWIVEFNHPYAWEADGAKPLYDKYPHSSDGQQSITQATIDMLNGHTNANGLIWWWPEFNKKDYVKPDYESWDGWYSSPLFSSYDGRALPATRVLASYAEPATVYFTNLPEGWTSAGVYAWADSGTNEGDWPGAAVELTDMTYKNKPVWKATFTGNHHKYLILNNRHQDAEGNWVSTDQTFDLTFRDGAIYYLQDWRSQDWSGNWKYDVWLQDEGAVPDNPCVYLTNLPDSWGTPRISAWLNDGDNEADGAWMEQTDYTYGGKKVYKYTFTGDRHANLLFFNDPWDGTNVTPTLDFASGALYILSDGKNAEGDSKHSAPWIVRPSFDNNDGSAGALYLFGNINGKEEWSGERDRFKASRKGIGDNTYTFDLDITQMSWFRLRTDDGTEWGPSGDIELKSGDNDKETEAGSGKAFSLPAGSYTVVVEYYDGKYVLGVGDRRIPAVYDDLYVIGSFTGWVADHDFRLIRQEDGKYTREFPDGLPSGTFKVAVADWSQAFSAGACDMHVNHTVRCYEMNRGGQDMNIPEAINGWAKVIFDPVKHTLRIEGPKDPVSESYENRIYMHFGQSRQTYGDLTMAPMVHLYADNRPDMASDEEVTGWNTFEMKRALEDDDSYDLWYYELTPDQLTWAADATFFYTRTDGSIEKYTCGQLVYDDELNWDYRQWMKYIYFADVADNYNGKAAQSYLTLPRFRELRNSSKDKLYVVGQGLRRLGPTQGWHTSGWDRIVEPDIYAADASLGVFYLDDIQANDNLAQSNTTDEDHAEHWGTKFKMSWIYPYGSYEASGYSGGSINQQRAWATFNLGIIGYGLRRAAAVNLVPTFGKNQTNYEVYCESCVTLPTNNFNQYDWFVDQEYLGDRKFTLVVDLHDECGSVTLLPFKPNPTAKSAGMTVTQGELDSYDDAISKWVEGADRLLAAENNGMSLYKKYNVAVANIDVEAPNSATLQENGYSVEYEMYLNREKRGVYEGLPGKVTISGVPVGETEMLGVRAKYTDNDTRFTFHSKYSEDVNAVNVETAAPVVGEPSFKCYTDGEDIDESTFTFGGYFLVPVTVATGLHWYGDFEMTPKEYTEGGLLSKGGELLHAGHDAHNKIHVMEGVSLTDWVPFSGEDGWGFSEANDWAHKLSHTANWPLYLPAVNTFARKYDYTDAELSCDTEMRAYAVYPFLIDFDAVPQGVSTQAAAPAKALAIQDGHRYGLRLIRRDSSRVLSLGRDAVSGIGNVDADGNVGEDVRYYNLQGVEVKGDLIPGVYIKCQGNTAVKVVVP